MSKNRLIITILAIFLLTGVTSFAMGATPATEATPATGATPNRLNDVLNMSQQKFDDIPVGFFDNVDVKNVAAANVSGQNVETDSAARLVIKDNGQIRDVAVLISPGSIEEINMYNTLNSAFLNKQKVKVQIDKIGNEKFITIVAYEVT